MLCKSSKWELGFVRYIPKFTISRFVISRFKCTKKWDFFSMAPLNNLKKNYLISYFFIFRFFYYCFLFFLPLTLIFLAWHLFVENCKWNFAGEEGVVPRPWPHTIYIPMIWFFSFLFAVPTVFWSDVRPLNDDFYRNEISYRNEPEKAQVSFDIYNL